MPVYEYHCAACGGRFSKLQPMSAPKEGNECPKCGTHHTRRLISSFASVGNAPDSFQGCYASCTPTG